MKKAILKTIFGAALVLFLNPAAKAQLSVSINIGNQPAWGPAGYNHVDYYYLPDIESYYDVSTGQYIYLDGGRWIFARTLPPRYRGYDLYSGYKVVVNRPKPYLNFSRDRVDYGRYRNWRGNRQPMLRETRNAGGRPGNNGGFNRPGNPGNNRPGNPGNNRPGNPGNNRPGNPGMNRPGNPNPGRPQNPGQQGGGRPQNPGQNGGRPPGQGGQPGGGRPGGNGGGHEDHGRH